MHPKKPTLPQLRPQLILLSAFAGLCLKVRVPVTVGDAGDSISEQLLLRRRAEVHRSAH